MFHVTSYGYSVPLFQVHASVSLETSVAEYVRHPVGER